MKRDVGYAPEKLRGGGLGVPPTFNKPHGASYCSWPGLRSVYADLG